MKIWISCDMEGVAGIVDWDQCRPGSDGYALGCALMQDEVNAAIEGAMAGGGPSSSSTTRTAGWPTSTRAR